MAAAVDSKKEKKEWVPFGYYSSPRAKKKKIKTIFEMRILDQKPRRQRRILFDANAYTSKAKNVDNRFSFRFFSEQKKKNYILLHSSYRHLKHIQYSMLHILYVRTYVRCALYNTYKSRKRIDFCFPRRRTQLTNQKYKTEIKCANASIHRVQYSSKFSTAFVNVCNIVLDSK